MDEKLLLKQLDENKEKKIVFWGASTFLLNFLLRNNIKYSNIVGIIDNNSELAGKSILNYKIYHPNNCSEIQFEAVVFSVKNKAVFNYDRVKKLIDKNFPNVEFLPNIFDKVAFEIISSNKLYLVYGNVKRQVSYVPGLNIEWKGKNSVIEIGAKPVPNFSNCLISIGDNSRVFIDSSLNPIKRLSVCMQYENCELKIGKHLHCNGVQMLITCEPNKKIIIGDNCLFSYGICMRTSDGHSVLDNNTKVLLNNSSGIKIGNHVWIGQNVMLLKNTKIADNSIVGANSVLRKAYNEANVAICGNPAKITKTNINWSAAEPHRYNQNLI